MIPTRRLLFCMVAALAATRPLGAWAQTPPATLTQPAPPAPAPPSVVSPVPAMPLPAPTPLPAATPVPAGLPTLIPGAGDMSDVDEVVLPEKPTLVLSGSAKWEGGLATLRAAFARVTAELAKDGLAPAGRPISVFTQTGDDGFKFDAMVPIAAAPATVPALPPEMRFATTPSGKAYRFVHKGPYDDIDTTYETVTAYLDAKDIVAKDAFVEEYIDDITDPGDPNLAINIFVQPK